MTTMTECGRRLKWAGGEHDFDLGAPRALKILAGDLGGIPHAFICRGYFYAVGGALDGQFGDTPAACLKRFEQGVYSIQDVERIIEIALYGGGMSAGEAVARVDKHVRGRPLAANALIAYEVLAALFVGAKNAST